MRNEYLPISALDCVHGFVLICIAAAITAVFAANGDVIADIVIKQANFTSGTAGALNLPQSVAVDSQGNLFVADFNHNRVLEFNTYLVTGQAQTRSLVSQILVLHNPKWQVQHRISSVPTGIALAGMETSRARSY